MATVGISLPWHNGEVAVHQRLGGVDLDNPTNSFLAPRAAIRLREAPLLAVGTLDVEGRPWTSIWGGSPGFAMHVGENMIAIMAEVDRKHDPVADILCQSGDTAAASKSSKMVSALTMDLDKRNRWKLYGRVAAARLREAEGGLSGHAQLIVRIDQSLGNCPKYINRKHITTAPMAPELVYIGDKLPSEALQVINKADLFFISSSNHQLDMDTNHRGGPPGFVRTKSENTAPTQIIWPEYSGNRLYQTLGNLEITPKAGLVFPDFDNGKVLYVTGTTKILYGKKASSIVPRSNLAVCLTVTEARLIQQGLSFRGVSIEASPYNPNVRPLASETPIKLASEDSRRNTAKLVKREELTPTISRLTFSMSNTPTQPAYAAGQWVALDFSDELDMGYSHMRDDDPRSLNDDFVRTFTVSSPPPPRTELGYGLSDDDFEVTMRNVGTVTAFMHRQRQGAHLEIPIRGFGGAFRVEAQPDGSITPFVAGGVGITPLLACLPNLEMAKLKLFWSLHIEDAGLAQDTLGRFPLLAPATHIFITGTASGSEAVDVAVESIVKSASSCHIRRLSKDDLGGDDIGSRWYSCTGPALRNTLLEWLDGKELICEDFNF